MADADPKREGRVRDGMLIYKNPDGADVDVIAVPGLGADPEGSWTWPTASEGEGPGFNWLKDENGLSSKASNARIMLWQYASAWIGATRVDQDITHIARDLLRAVQAERKECSERAIVFVGHSMGGLVIAKAVCIAYTYREEYMGLFECVTGCMFFGTPFQGAVPAKTALMYATIANDHNARLYTTLLDLLSEGNLALQELRAEFQHMSARMATKIQIRCVWEEGWTKFSKMMEAVAQRTEMPPRRKAILLRSLKERGLLEEQEESEETSEQQAGGNIWAQVAKRLSFEIQDVDNTPFVTKKSALLDNDPDAFPLMSNHQNLVRFKGPGDEKFRKVIEPLEAMIDDASAAATHRLKASQGFKKSFQIAKKVIAKFNAVQISRLRSALNRQNVPSNAISGSKEYKTWFSDQQQQNSIIWLRGRGGSGKTATSLKCIEELDETLRNAQGRSPSGRANILVSYFFCLPATDYCTSDDILRSFVTQMIDQHETLAIHARRFVKGGSDGGGESTHTMTLENLWQCFEEMLESEGTIKKAYFVINNLHEMVDAEQLLSKIVRTFGKKSRSDGLLRTRWLITSRQQRALEDFLRDQADLIDLDTDEFGQQFKQYLSKHIDLRVEHLTKNKGYDVVLRTQLRMEINQLAQDKIWVDVIYVLLNSIDKGTEENVVTDRLWKAGQKRRVDEIVSDEWKEILQRSGSQQVNLTQFLKVLLLAFEPPTLGEAAVIAGCRNEANVRRFVQQSSPFVRIQFWEDGSERIVFANDAIKEILLRNAHGILGLSPNDPGRVPLENQFVHGAIAIRSLDYVKKLEQKKLAAAATAAAAAAAAAAEAEERGEKVEKSDAPKEGEGKEASVRRDSATSETPPEEAPVLQYPVKYWMRHGSMARTRTAEEVRLEFPEFWVKDSAIRTAWLRDYTKLESTHELKRWPLESLGAVHTAASLGYTQLVASLISNGHEGEVGVHDAWHNTPLHLAAYYGHLRTARELLDRGEDVNDGDGKVDTPLHMAAANGQIEMMKLLLERNANINAFTSSVGLVIHCAIRSGKIEAVELILERTTELRHPQLVPPLRYAVMSDAELFNKLLGTERTVWTQGDLDSALVGACLVGRCDLMSTLLSPPRKFSDECIQEAFDKATKNMKWLAMKLLLEYRKKGIKCEEAFEVAAEHSTIGRQNIVKDLWAYNGGSMPKETLNNALFRATDNQKEHTVRWLLQECKADANATGPRVHTALAAAAEDGTLAIVELLIAHGARPGEGKGFPLYFAARNGFDEVVKRLLKFGEDVNKVDMEVACRTALHIACIFNRRSVVEILLDAGADPNIGETEFSCPIIAATVRGSESLVQLIINAGKKNPAQKVALNILGGKEQQSPLVNATLKMSAALVEELINAGADVNLPDNKGNTAIMEASTRGDVDCVKLLIQNKADILHKNNEGKTAFDFASEGTKPGHPDVLRILTSSLVPVLERLREASALANATARWILDPTDEKASRPGAEESMPVVQVHSEPVVSQDGHVHCPRCTEELLCPGCEPAAYIREIASSTQKAMASLQSQEVPLPAPMSDDSSSALDVSVTTPPPIPRRPVPSTTSSADHLQGQTATGLSPNPTSVELSRPQSRNGSVDLKKGASGEDWRTVLSRGAASSVVAAQNMLQESDKFKDIRQATGKATGKLAMFSRRKKDGAKEGDNEA